MARVVQVGWVSPIPESKHLGYVWVEDYCCVVRTDEIKRGMKALLVEPGESVPLCDREFAWLGTGSRHTVRPTSFFGYRSEALLVPHAVAQDFEVGDQVNTQCGIHGPPGTHAGCMKPQRAALCLLFGAAIGLVTALACEDVLTPASALYFMFGLLVAYGFVNIGLSLYGRAS